MFLYKTRQVCEKDRSSCLGGVEAKLIMTCVATKMFSKVFTLDTSLLRNPNRHAYWGKDIHYYFFFNVCKLSKVSISKQELLVHV